MRSSYKPRGRGRRFQPPQDKDTHRINNNIKAANVRLISDTGEQLGILDIKDALAKAEEAGLDLVEVSPNSDPPVCKLMDYGKFKYREQKKTAEARKKRSEQTVKELRIRYRTDVGDLETKLKKAREFLAEGDKVKFSMRFRGREVMYRDLGQEKFNEVIEKLSDVAVLDDRSPNQGRQIYIVLAPKK
ncbi:MAG: translation initiation factor IF-3 [Candidatus Dadabacteria bacterium]|nr:MAG: translation initiation factor IF-3 [Candidatus Dadabacteria bacterium]